MHLQICYTTHLFYLFTVEGVLVAQRMSTAQVFSNTWITMQTMSYLNINMC